MNGRTRTRRIFPRVVRWCAIAAVTVAGTWPGAAYAQKETVIHTEETPFKSWILVAVASGLVLAIAVKNSKRSHLG